LPRMKNQIVVFRSVFQQRLIHDSLISFTIDHEIYVSCHVRWNCIRTNFFVRMQYSCSPCFICLTGVITRMGIPIDSRISQGFIRDMEHVYTKFKHGKDLEKVEHDLRVSVSK
jgi:hypothetical protein